MTQVIDETEVLTVTAYELWCTDRAILLSAKPAARNGEWVSLANAEITRHRDISNAVTVVATRRELRRAGLLI